MRNQEAKTELQKKVRRRMYVKDITFLTACHFLLLSSFILTPFSSDVLAECTAQKMKYFMYFIQGLLQYVTKSAVSCRFGHIY